MTEPIYVAKGASELHLLPKMANRHGLVAGATGTGKTVTLQRLAEGFSRIGVPVFLADVKGDLSGICQPGTEKPFIKQRVDSLGLMDFKFTASPVIFWDVFGEQGHPVRSTISEMGPLLLARLLNLNDIQTSVLELTFKIADDCGLLLLDLKDLRAMLQFLGDHGRELTTTYGNISAASIGAIQRGLLTLEQQGGDSFFAEPALKLTDLIRTAPDGRGYINILAADKLLNSPKLYATFLLWLLSELFEELPELGDPEKPKLVFFFDEAHLLFKDVSDTVLDKIEQVVRLVRSKGIGVYFVTQNPLDVPDTVLGQLGNRVQHALRAFTPRDQKAVKAAATTFRPNPDLDTAETITQLGVGEALVSFLDAKGMPSIVDRAFVLPPCGQIGPITPEQRKHQILQSPLFGTYEPSFDRESAYEVLMARAGQAAEEEATAPEGIPAGTPARQPKTTARAKEKPSSTRKVVEAFATSAARSIASTVGRELSRGVLGGLLGKKPTPRKK